MNRSTSIPSRFLLALFLLPLLAITPACAAIADDDDDDRATEQNIVEIAVANDFTTLVAALQAADLVSTLEGEGPFTVFAPTDAAFAKLPDGTVEDLLRPENRDQLVAVLTYHVVQGEVTSEQVVNLNSASTLQGSEISISVVDGQVRINDATVTTADVNATNGVVHVIDTVLLPPAN